MQGFDPHKAHIEVAHPYLTMMGLYLGGFTGMFSETSLNIALPQLTEAFGLIGQNVCLYGTCVPYCQSSQNGNGS
ncbi:hypothetical protein, partial [uncultured Senegalimassilia sp.]|uniref:hypothetical protein n=1 Tax=uncultured Senegalimassilia sp. TaxID=1714350 RepID=UPI0025DFC18D